jgi:uncharacterized membrane protein YfcA
VSDWQLLIYALVGLVMSVLSGITGGGGGFVMTPLAILLGLTPAQAVSTGKLNGLAITVGSLGGLRKVHGKVSKLRVGSIMLLAFAVGLLVPLVIKSLESDAYRVILGILLLLMIPIMHLKKMGIEPGHPSLATKGLGGVLLTIALFLQGAFSGGLGVLVNVVLMGMLGQTATEANLTKRWSQLILNITIIIGVLSTGFIIWKVAVVGMTTSILGGFIGGHMAVKKGDKFAVDVMLVLMLASALFLIIGAL